MEEYEVRVAKYEDMLDMLLNRGINKDESLGLVAEKLHVLSDMVKFYRGMLYNINKDRES